LTETSVVAAHEIEKVGDNASEAGRDMLSLAARIEVAKAALHGLSLEFAGSGDNSLTPKIKQARRELSELQRVAKTLTPAGAAAGQGIVASLGDLGASLRGSMIPLLIGVGAAASPAIASAVGAAVVGGIGLGGIIGGIALAAQDPRVPTAFKPLGAAMMTGLTTDAKAFVGPLLQVAEDIGVAWEARIRPHIAAAFANLAPSLRGLAAGGTGFLEHLAAGFERVSEAAGPFLDQFGRDLPELGADMERFMNSVSDAGPEVTRFFHDMNSGLGTTIAGLGKFIQFGAELNDVLPVGGLVASLGRLADATDTNVETNDAWIRSLFGVSGGLMNVSQIMQAYNTQTGIAATATSQIQASMQVMNSQLVANATAAAMAGAKNQELTASFQNAAHAVGGLKTAFDELNGPAINFAQAEINVENALAEMKTALDASNGSLNVHTEKGRAARQAVLNFAEASAIAMQAKIDETKSVDDAQKKYQEYRGELVRSLIQAGSTRKEAERLADAWLKMPKDVKTKVSAPGATASKAAVDALAGAIAGLHGKTINVVTRFSTIGSAPSSAHRIISNAKGTPSAPPGLSWVGEEGPELMSLVGGERIFPHAQSMSMARGYAGGTGGGSWGGPVNLTVNLQIDSFGNISRKALITDAKGRGVGEATIRAAYP
jgi:hypothetical protein